MTIILTTYVSLLHDQHIGFGFENKRHSTLALAFMQKDGRRFWIIVLKKHSKTGQILTSIRSLL